MEENLVNEDFEKKHEKNQIIQEIFLELELPEEQKEINEISTILKDLLVLFNNLKNVKNEKIDLVEEIYLMFFNLGIALLAQHELIYNDPEIINLNQEIANLFIECYSNFKSYFAQYSSICSWDEDATIILQVRSGFEFLCEYFKHINVAALKTEEHQFRNLLTDLKSYDELSDFDYKIENWENCPLRMKDIPRNIPLNHVWWFPAENNTKVKPCGINSTGSFLQIAKILENELFIDYSNFNNIVDKVGDRPLSIISLIGPSGSNKSIMIDCMLKYRNLPQEYWFNGKYDRDVHCQNPTEQQRTAIYMWSNPFFRKINDREIAILVIDTQGCFDNKNINSENSMIFALSYLLSSTIIYNITNELSEDILHVLKFYVGFANLIEDSKKTLAYTNLIFLIRDWKLPNKFEYGYYDETTSPSTENFMKENSGLKPNMLPEFRIVREEITPNFQNIGSYLLPCPGDHFAKVKTNDMISFIEYTKEFIHRIFDAKYITTKKIDGNEINGSQLKQFVERWAIYLKEIEITEVNGDSNGEIQNQIAYNISLKYYRREMEKILKYSEGITDEYYEENHKKIRQEAIKTFKRIEQIENDKIESRYLKLLEENIQLAFENYKLTNLTNRKFQVFKVESEKSQEIFKKQFETQGQESEMKQEKLILDLKKQIQESCEKQQQIKRDLGRQAYESKEIQQQIKKELMKQVREVEKKQQQLKIVMEKKALESEELQKKLLNDLKKQKQESEEKQKQLKIEMFKKAKESEEIKKQLQKVSNKFKKQNEQIEESKKTFKHEIEKLSHEIERNTNKTQLERNFYFIVYIVILAIVINLLGWPKLGGATVLAFIAMLLVQQRGHSYLSF